MRNFLLQVEKIKENVESIKATIREKGVEVPEDARLADLPELIGKIGS